MVPRIATMKRAARLPMVALAALGLMLLATGPAVVSASSHTGDGQSNGEGDGQARGMQLSASDLRVKMNLLLQEHVYLTLAATEEIIEGGEELQSAENTLDMQNTVPLADLIGMAYGESARDQFLTLWRDHIGFFFDYARGVDDDDQDMRDTARSSLDGYVSDIADFLSGANPNLTQETVSGVFSAHVETMLAAIDAQDQDGGDEYHAVWEAAALVSGGADALASAIAKQFPEMFSDDSGMGASSGSASPGNGYSGNSSGS